MIKTSVETKVGILFFLTLVILGIFVYLLGAFNPFISTYNVKVVFNYAGGLDVGSPVRAAGVKIGRVKKIEFLKEENKNLQILVTMQLKSSVKDSIKSDSKFFINMSGLIGEKYIEISPGSSPQNLEDGTIVAGIDPPRIDQLISESYELFSKLQSFMDNNKDNLAKVLGVFENLTSALNGFFNSATPKDKANIRDIISNVKNLTDNLSSISQETKNTIVPMLVELKPTVENIKVASSEVASFTKFLGSLNKSDKKEFENAVKNITSISGDLAKIVTRAEGILKRVEDFHLEEYKTILKDTGVKVRVF